MSQDLGLGPDALSAYSDMVDEGEVTYLIFKIDEDGSTIVPEKDGEGHDDFLANLPDDECRWGLSEMDLGPYGSLCSFEPVLFTWLPPGAPEAERALYERSSGILAEGFDNVLVSTAVTGSAEASHEAVLNQLAVAGHPRQLELPEGEFSLGRFAPKLSQLVFELRDDATRETVSHSHAVLKLNRFFMHDVAQTGDPSAPMDELFAGLPPDDCRWAVYTMDISSLTSKPGDTYTYFFTWLPDAAPEAIRRLFRVRGTGTAMGNFEERFTPTGMLVIKIEQVVDCFMGEISDISAVSHEVLWEVARRRFKPTPAERAEDEDADRRLRQEARDQRQEDAIRQEEVEEGGMYR